MSDEQDKQQPSSDQHEEAEKPEATEAGPSAETPDEERSFKEAARETVAKAVGWGVEVGSILGGEGGDIVPAQREVAEAETEELIDRIDGED